MLCAVLREKSLTAPKLSKLKALNRTLEELEKQKRRDREMLAKKG